MPIPVTCPGCHARLNAQDAAAGKTLNCPKCRTPIAVPAPPAFEVIEEEPPPPPPRKAPPAKVHVEVADEDEIEVEEEVRPRARRRADDDEDDEDDRPRRRRATGGGAAPVLRFVSPGTFGLAVVLFFLPWTDLHCHGPKGKIQLFTQSAYQSAVGEVSEGDGFSELKKEFGGADAGAKGPKPSELFAQGKHPGGKADGDGKEDGPDKAPLLWVYLGFVVLGALLPTAIADPRARGALVLGFAALALLVAAGSAAAGLPLAKTADDFNKEMKGVDVGGFGGLGGLGGGKAGAKPGGKLADAITPEMKCSYLLSFWLSLALLAGTAGVGGVQLALAGGGSKSQRRKKARRRRDEEDDDEDG
jgi:hypothetical protein